jgi:hypothetical protein
MSQLSRKEYLAKMRWRYAQRGREGKSRLLDELCEVCAYDRKYAIKLLGSEPAATKGKVGRKLVYATEVVAVIKLIWLSSEQPCGKRLKELPPLWLPHFERREGTLSKYMLQLIGYDPLGEEACMEVFNAVYEDWNLLQNLFCPTMKLKDKRAWIKHQQREQDPFELHRRVEVKLRALWKIVRDATAEDDEEPTSPTTAEVRGGARFCAVDPCVTASLSAPSTPGSTAQKPRAV